MLSSGMQRGWDSCAAGPQVNGLSAGHQDHTSSATSTTSCSFSVLLLFAQFVALVSTGETALRN